MAVIKHVIVLMMENRSFDEYFGTFPGAAGFNDTNNAQAFTQPWGSIGTLQPFRKSTFTSTGLITQQLGHDWFTMHTAVKNGPNGAVNNMNFFLSQTLEGWGAQAPNGVMAYFAANDIPYQWALAQYFVLCDNYFCSALAGTEANRLFLVGGTNYDPESFAHSGPGGENYQTSPGSSPDVVTYNESMADVPWPNYLADLHEWQLANPPGSQPLYRIYDDSNWQFNWNYSNQDSTGQSINPFVNYGPYTDSSGNTIWLGNGIQSGGQTLDPNCQAPNVNGAPDVPLNPPPILNDNRPLFAQHVLPDPSNPGNPSPVLATLTWIAPPVLYSEHPPGISGFVGDGGWSPATGALYMAYIVDALMNSQFWEETVLIITWDETDTHFDHVPPPLNTDSSAEPFVFESQSPDDKTSVSVAGINYNAPIGAGMRVPAIIVSPYTIGKGVCHEPMDHTSILRLMTTVSGIPCKNGTGKPANDGTGVTQPSKFRIDTFRNMADVIGDLAGQEGSPPQPLPPVSVASQFLSNAIARYKAQGGPDSGGEAADPTPPSPIPLPVTQSIEVIMTAGSYDLAQVQALAGGQAQATIPNALSVLLIGFEPDELTDSHAVGQFSTVNVSGSSGSIRAPAINFSPSLGITTSNVSVDKDPYSIPTASGVPSVFTFTYDVVLSDLSTIFPPVPPGQGVPPAATVIVVNAVFQSDATFTAKAEIELVSAPDPQFYKNFIDDTTWLSGELVVFSLPAGKSMFNAPSLGDPQHPTQATSSDALNFINEVIENLNSGMAPKSSFDALSAPEAANPVSLLLTQPGDIPVYNFALARVYMNSPNGADNVRVFFRSGRASISACTYDASGTNTGPSSTPAFYRSNPAVGHRTGVDDTKIPLLGVQSVVPPSGGNATFEYTSIPFFATKRVNFDDLSMPMTDQPADSPLLQGTGTGQGNVRKILPASGGTPSVAYFGCWLDVNQDVPLIPTTVPASSSDWDGPFSGLDPKPIHTAFTGDFHQCLIAEISFDPITIPYGDVPGYSAWLAQRNLALVTS